MILNIFIFIFLFRIFYILVIIYVSFEAISEFLIFHIFDFYIFRLTNYSCFPISGTH